MEQLSIPYSTSTRCQARSTELTLQQCDDIGPLRRCLRHLVRFTRSLKAYE